MTGGNFEMLYFAKIRRTALVNTLLFTAVLALFPITTRAQCQVWEASGLITIIQRGSTDPIILKLEQKGRVLTGWASYNAENGKYGGFGRTRLRGRVDGTINGAELNFQIFWPDSLTGVYTATVLPSGRLQGETYDKNRPKTRQTWYTEGVLKCLPTYVSPKPAKPAPKPPPKPLKTPVKTLPVKTEPPPPMKVPGIVASQTIFPQVGANTGFVILTWDAGPDNPYAEVWYKVNGAPPIFLLEQGKGTHRMTIERYRQYEFILTDAGKTLSTVVVVTN